jgi:hypothetical protein
MLGDVDSIVARLMSSTESRSLGHFFTNIKLKGERMGEKTTGKSVSLNIVDQDFRFPPCLSKLHINKGYKLA